MDIYLKNGEMIIVFKILKYFEIVLLNFFIRIYNSYIVNCNFILRIYMGNLLCYIKKMIIKFLFLKFYKVNVDFIISEFVNENYIEI